MLISSTVNVAALIPWSNVRTTRSIGARRSPEGLVLRIRGPVGFGVMVARYASTMPPVAVFPARSASGLTVASTRATSAAGVAKGSSPATSETTPLTCAVDIEVPLQST